MIKYLKLCFFLLFAFSGKDSKSQKITNIPSYRNFSNDTYFRLNFDNDFFAHSDDNYTQGVSLEFVAPLFKKNPVNCLFFNSEKIAHYGIAIEHVSFTPDVISKKEIQYGFRPFAAALYLKFFKTEENKTNRSRIYSSLTAGVIGPIAYGKEGQSYIHEVTDNWVPYGWRNQISNDVLINYEIKHEKRLLDLGNLFYLNTDAGLRLGSMYTDVSAGITGVLGLFNSSLNDHSRKNKFQLYLYNNPRIYLVGYDATLQGGLFSNSVYVIEADDIKRIKAQMDYGIVLMNKFFYLEYTYSLITREYKTGATQKWGGFRVGFRL